MSRLRRVSASARRAKGSFASRWSKMSSASDRQRAASGRCCERTDPQRKRLERSSWGARGQRLEDLPEPPFQRPTDLRLGFALALRSAAVGQRDFRQRFRWAFDWYSIISAGPLAADLAPEAMIVEQDSRRRIGGCDMVIIADRNQLIDANCVSEGLDSQDEHGGRRNLAVALRRFAHFLAPADPPLNAPDEQDRFSVDVE